MFLPPAGFVLGPTLAAGSPGRPPAVLVVRPLSWSSSTAVPQPRWPTLPARPHPKGW